MDKFQDKNDDALMDLLSDSEFNVDEKTIIKQTTNIDVLS